MSKELSKGLDKQMNKEMKKEIEQIKDKYAKAQAKVQARVPQEKEPQGMRVKMSEVARMSPETMLRLYRISKRY